MHRSVLGALAASVISLLAIAPAAAAAPAECTVGTFLSEDAGRGEARPLDGRTVLGEVYVFADALAELDRVTFTLSGGQGVVRTVVEETADWDLGTTGDGGLARPLRTTDLPDGVYTLRAEWAYAGRSAAGCADAPRSATATFTVDNAFTCGVGILVSDRADRRGGRYLSGESLTRDAHVFIDDPRHPRQELSESTAVVDEVRFALYRLDHRPGGGGFGRNDVLQRVEGHAAFDLLGTGPDGRARPLRLAAFPPGTYVVTAEWTYKDESVFGCGDTNHGTGATFLVPEAS